MKSKSESLIHQIKTFLLEFVFLGESRSLDFYTYYATANHLLNLNDEKSIQEKSLNETNKNQRQLRLDQCTYCVLAQSRYQAMTS